MIGWPMYYVIGTSVGTLAYTTYMVAVCCSVMQCAAVCCSVMQCAAVCCSVLQCVAVCCSVLQCAAVCCSVLQCVAVCCITPAYTTYTLLSSVGNCGTIILSRGAYTISSSHQLAHILHTLYHHQSAIPSTHTTICVRKLSSHVFTFDFSRQWYYHTLTNSRGMLRGTHISPRSITFVTGIIIYWLLNPQK